MAPKKMGASKSSKRESSILENISKSEIVSQGRRAACDAVYVSKKLLRSTGKAAWFAGTTVLIVVLPWIMMMDQEQRLMEMEFEQSSLLGIPVSGSFM